MRLWPPIPRPRANIYAVGWNYLNHFEEGKAVKEYPANPVFFAKGVNTMNAPFDTIPYDASNSTQVDWEARNISEKQAMQHVTGIGILRNPIRAEG